MTAKELAFIPKQFDIQKVIKSHKYYKILFAKNQDIQQFVFIKALTLDGAQDIFITNEFRRECRIAKKMSSFAHPCIPRILYVEHGMGPRFYIMEGTAGSTLEEYMTQHKIPQEIATRITLQIAQGLDALYTQFEIIHRDLSPDNIYLTRDLQPKICNLQSIKNADVTTITSHGGVKGSMLFTAPEICSEHFDYSIQSDMYSLGLIFLYMLQNKLPIESVEDIFDFDVTQLSLEEYSAQPILLKMLHKNPNERFANYAELINELQPIYNTYTPATVTTSGPQTDVADARLSMWEAKLDNIAKKLAILEQKQENLTQALNVTLTGMNNKITQLEAENQRIKQYLSQMFNK
ncbi:serine/threonine-protein kinase [Candidatus Uabimicrobium amorphum]|uniref:Protein kinase n=1 Tax=Uabimicrobium amorphum TaxID=2596890 RepID=A0A5S9ITZ2_UABAM|nr:serine/threonine-protein kinase [Candidatus Uabimicrobium amorphum]BBM87341.1 protein kinase [Candidatus Uabimicrobium amorphum]